MLSAAPLFCATPVLLAVAYCDLRHLRIPNALSYMLLAIFVFTWVIAPPPDLAARLVVAGAILIAGCGAFFAGLIGAGDVKIGASLALLLPAAQIDGFGYLLAACTALGLVSLRAVRPHLQGLHWAAFAGGPEFPMGLPIALAGIAYPWLALGVGRP